MHKESSSQAKYVLTVCLTLVFCVISFCFWLPEHIGKKAEVVFNPLMHKIKVAEKADDTAVTEDLIQYINSDQFADNSETDALNEEDLASHFEIIHDDFISSADKILKSRFRLPDLKTDPSRDASFVVSEGLKDVVNFWTHIFGVYNKDHMVFYNGDYVGIVYSVLDFSDLADGVKGASSVKRKMVKQERRRLVKILKKLAKRFKEAKKRSTDQKVTISLSKLNKEEKRIAKLLMKESDHIRLTEKGLIKGFSYRKGFSHRIKEAIKVSGKYMDEMKRIFRERGLPDELTVIPFIESAFNLSAYSHAGAAGVWQFIAPTGKRYLKIDKYADERYDPILATYASATHLTNEFELLGTWPLTINAYNAGPGRLQKAVKKLKTTDIATIIKKYSGGGYGFDSRNYYPEFLAILDVYENQEYYFNDIELLEPEEYVYLALPSPMNVKELSRLAGIDIQDLAEMNLALKPAVLQGSTELPKGYLLKLEPKSKENVLLAMQELFDEVRYASHHVVSHGDTLRRVARRYEVSVKKLAVYNQMLPGEKLKPGSIVRLPSRGNDVELTLKKGGSELILPDKLQTPVF